MSSSVINEIENERRRQIVVEGHYSEDDDEYDGGELAAAAGCYALENTATQDFDAMEFWPWDRQWWKPKNRRRDLIRAAARCGRD